MTSWYLPLQCFLSNCENFTFPHLRDDHLPRDLPREPAGDPEQGGDKVRGGGPRPLHPLPLGHSTEDLLPALG